MKSILGIGRCEKVKSSIFLGAEMQKAQASNERLCLGTRICRMIINLSYEMATPCRVSIED